MRDVSKIISVRNFKLGNYQVVKYLTNCFGKDLEMSSAFSKPKLEYIGDPKWAWRLTHKFGITEQIQSVEGRPEIENRDLAQEAKRLLLSDFMRDYSFSPCCSIGFNPSEQKWYGWSHRAIYGFGIGSEVKKGHCAYTPVDKQDCIDDYIRFWTGDFHENVHFDREEGDKGFWISWTFSKNVPNEKMRGKIDSVFCRYPDNWGRGTWIAETLDDAKQMAIDFANGVS
jgi:hypothetical protein